jgi:hypothetical protein
MKNGNYKIRITRQNQAIVKRIADENGMNPNNFQFMLTKTFYIIKDNKFYVANINYAENIFLDHKELTIEQFIELFDKKETELEKWLRETKAKNLSLDELNILIENCDEDIYYELKGDGIIEKAEILFNQWNNPTEESPKVENKWQPKRGERVLVWDSEGNDLKERIFLIKIESAIYPIITVGIKYGNEFNNGEKFGIECYKNMKPLPIEQPKEDKVEEVAYQYCKKLGINNSNYSVDIIQSFINGAKWQSEQPIDTDFKSKVIELIESENQKALVYYDDAIYSKNYLDAHAYIFKSNVYKDLLNQIKQL